MSSDPRVADWLLMKTTFPVITAFCLYMTLVFLGPRLMQNRPAFSLKYPIILYNCVLVYWSVYMFYEVRRHLFIYIFIYFITSCCCGHVSYNSMYYTPMAPVGLCVQPSKLCDIMSSCTFASRNGYIMVCKDRRRWHGIYLCLLSDPT